MKCLTVAGVRPEFIRLSELIKKLDKYANHVFVNTNQSFDYQMSGVFFDELQIRKPDYVLDVKSDTVGEQIGKIIAQTEAVMIKEKPDAVVILGDTNSSLACIVAKRLQIPIFHLEAGNRAFDNRVPEEINRRIIDHTADINICYSEHGRRNLIREGLPIDKIFVMGSPLPEVYYVHRMGIQNSKILETMNLKSDCYILASIHREENLANNERFLKILNALNEMGMPVILTAHPRTRRKIEELALPFAAINIHEPFGMFDYVKLQLNAFVNIVDSGTIHEDASIFGIPAINLRNSQERPEVYDTGNVVMTDVEGLESSVDMVRQQREVMFAVPFDYRSDNFSDKVVRLIVGQWKIIRKKEYGW